MNCKTENIITALKLIYQDAIEDATGWYLSYYCSSDEEKNKRLQQDEENKEFFNLLLDKLVEIK